MATPLPIIGKDIPIHDLIPLHVRDINFKTNRGFRKILSSIQAIGLIEPLAVYEEDEKYVILDGFLRYKAFEQLQIELVPCIIYPDKEAYTFNRMVNRLSPYQESRMLRKSLEKLDAGTIETVLGVKSLTYRINKNMYESLHPEVIKIIDKNQMSRKCASELSLVTKDRQREILREMQKSHDFSLSLARAMVIKTPTGQRNQNTTKKKLWFEDSAKKKELVAKLEEIEKRYDFYTNLYRQYTADLLKLCIYVRKIVTNQNIRAYLSAKYLGILEIFEKIVFDTEEKKAI